MKKLFVPVTILALALGTTLTSCNKDDDDDIVEQSNIVELAVATEDLSSLVAAVQRAGLVDALSDESVNYTVFAPTNAAFAAFLSANNFNSVDSVPVALLQQVLLNHVLGTEVKAADVTTGYFKTLASYNGTSSNIDMFIDASALRINGGSNIGTTDVDASNGVVHIVDAVIGIPKIPTFAAANPDFSILVQALKRSDLSTNYVEDVLNGDGPFTVFAPTNDAFTDLLAELQVSGLADIDAATLEAVLTYHVASGNTLAGTLTEGQVVTTDQTGTFTISLAGGATKITDGAGRETNIIATDIQASNGVVHAIDRVLLPQ